MKRGKIINIILTTLIIVTLITNANATISKGNVSYQITKEYPRGEIINGWVNISIGKEPINTSVKGNYGGEITIKRLIEENLAGYTCTPSDCGNEYTHGSNVKGQEITLNNEDKVLVMNIKGNIEGIPKNTHSIKITAKNTETCLNPLKIDYLNDGTIEWSADKSTTDGEYSCVYDNGAGCYTDNENEGLIELTTTPYCNKIKLPEGPKFEIGGFIKDERTTSSVAQLKMSLYDLEGDEMKSCNINILGDNKWVKCNVDYANPEIKDYYLCMSTKESVSGIKTKYETKNSCGFYGYPPQTTTSADYALTARAARYANIGSIEFNNTIYEKKGNPGSLEDYMWDYIQEKYDGNCTGSEGCNIPIRFSSKGTVNITITSVKMKYETNIGIPESNEVYTTSTTEARISTNGFQKLYLRAGNFGVPTDYGNRTIRITIGTLELFNEMISIKKIPTITDVNPKIIASFKKTIITAVIGKTDNRTIKYEWNYGDGKKETTTTNIVEHTYESLGNRTLNLTITDADNNQYSKSFIIRVVSPKEVINETIEDYKTRINILRTKLDTKQQWYYDEIKKDLEITSNEEKLKKLTTDYNNALKDNDEEEYLRIMSELAKMNIPKEIAISRKSRGIPITNPETINKEKIEDIAGSTYSKSGDIDKGILIWNEQNTQATMDYEIISGYSGTEENVIGINYKIMIKPKTQTGTIYIIIEDNGTVKSGEKISKEGTSTGITITNPTVDKIIEYYTTNPTLIDNPETIRMYYSPEPMVVEGFIDTSTIDYCNYNSICESSLGETQEGCSNDCQPETSKVLIPIIIVLLLGLITFIVLMWWYKNHYERHLFKNPNDMKNILKYIRDSEGRGTGKRAIKEKLKEAGWTNEQISYAYKKNNKFDKAL